MKGLYKRAFMLITIQLMLVMSATSAWASNPADQFTAIELREMTVKSGAIEWVLFVQGAALALLIWVLLNVSMRQQLLAGLRWIRPAESSPDGDNDHNG